MERFKRENKLFFGKLRAAEFAQGCRAHPDDDHHVRDCELLGRLLVVKGRQGAQLPERSRRRAPSRCRTAAGAAWASAFGRRPAFQSDQARASLAGTTGRKPHQSRRRLSAG